MNGDIEELVLSGKLFAPAERSGSPVRTPTSSRSPSPAAWPTDADADDFDYDSDAERRAAIAAHTAAQHTEPSIGMGPGRTGVKGVIRDRDEAAALARARRAQEVRELNAAMASASLGGKTWGEEERERHAEGEERRRHAGRFGFLREVGVRGYVGAVEEDRRTWVLVHIYDPSLDRCADLDDTLARLARLHPDVKFLRARAGALGFASSGSKPVFQAPFPLRHSQSRRMLVPGRYPQDADDEDDPFADGGDSGDERAADEWDDDAVDTDVLPTLLVYRGGQLEHAWVRVDWEAKHGVEELLRRHDILTGAGSSAELGISFSAYSDDELDDGEIVFGGGDDDLRYCGGIE